MSVSHDEIQLGMGRGVPDSAKTPNRAVVKPGFEA
jgi:hypothetical protein